MAALVCAAHWSAVWLKAQCEMPPAQCSLCRRSPVCARGARWWTRHILQLPRLNFLGTRNFSARCTMRSARNIRNGSSRMATLPSAMRTSRGSKSCWVFRYSSNAHMRIMLARHIKPKKMVFHSRLLPHETYRMNGCNISKPRKDSSSFQTAVSWRINLKRNQRE